MESKFSFPIESLGQEVFNKYLWLSLHFRGRLPWLYGFVDLIYSDLCTLHLQQGRLSLLATLSLGESCWLFAANWFQYNLYIILILLHTYRVSLNLKPLFTFFFFLTSIHIWSLLCQEKLMEILGMERKWDSD